MFDRYVSARTDKPNKGRTLMVLLSVTLHGAGIFALVFYSFWKIDRVAPKEQPITLAPSTAPPPPPAPAAAPPAAHTAPVHPDVHALKQPKPLDIVQPVPDAKPPAVDDTPPSNSDGDGKGPPDSTGTGTCVGDHCPPSTCVGDGCTGTAPSETSPVIPQTPFKVSISQLARISGQEQIALTPTVKQVLIAQGTRTFKVPVRLCLLTAGVPTSVSVRTAYAELNEKIEHEMANWRYSPYTVNGSAVPVCTAVLLDYRIE